MKATMGHLPAVTKNTFLSDSLRYWTVTALLEDKIVLVTISINANNVAIVFVL